MLQANSSLWSPCNGVKTIENWVWNLLTNFGKLWTNLITLKLFEEVLIIILKDYVILSFFSKKKNVTWKCDIVFLNSKGQSWTIGKISQKLGSHLLDNGPLWFYIGFLIGLQTLSKKSDWILLPGISFGPSSTITDDWVLCLSLFQSSKWVLRNKSDYLHHFGNLYH